MFQKVNFETYKIFKGKKAKFKNINISNKKGKRRKEYIYNYYIYTLTKPLQKTFIIKSYIQYINVNINKYFDEISHKKIYELTPLTNKYRYFIKY
jgi:hypothetical protein